VAIAVITTGVIGIAGAVGATERLAGINQDQSQLEVAMRQFADYVRADVASDPSTLGLQYRLCAQPATYNGHLRFAPSGLTWTVTNVNLSLTNDGSTPPASPGNGRRNGTPTAAISTSGCPSGTGDWGVQEITLKVSNAQRSITRTIWKSYSW
jgi:hypothetical protein